MIWTNNTNYFAANNSLPRLSFKRTDHSNFLLGICGKLFDVGIFRKMHVVPDIQSVFIGTSGINC